ncbi:MAG TPA: YwiC-like family protein [Stellaceae bacterium]|nr:YwiC-like family protein [Candidatus Sulfotelmatobacter sp.]HVH81424.1 YwiC-like family protein [Stellaceae bacterium]
MTAKTELTEDQKSWVVDVSHVLGSASPHSHSTDGGTLRVGELKVSFLDADAARNRRQRARALIVPREHGAWGLLLVPMVTGAGIAFREAGNVAPFLLLMVGALALFWLRTPLESLLGTSAMRAQTKDERRSVASAIGCFGGVALLTLGALLRSGRNPLLWLIGATAGAAFAGQALLKLMSRQPLSKTSAHRLRMLSEIVGTIGLTAAAPAAYYVITGKFGVTAWVVWAANLIFAGDQIHYVQLRLHTARIEGFLAKLKRGWAFAAGQALMTAALTLACLFRIIPPITSIAFSPILFRGWFYFIQNPTSPLVVRKLGWNELAHAVVFSVLLIATFAVAR